MPRQRTAARRTLDILQNVSIDPSDDHSSSDTKVDPVVSAAVASAMMIESDKSNDSIPEESDSDD